MGYQISNIQCWILNNSELMRWPQREIVFLGSQFALICLFRGNILNSWIFLRDLQFVIRNFIPFSWISSCFLILGLHFDTYFADIFLILRHSPHIVGSSLYSANIQTLLQMAPKQMASLKGSVGVCCFTTQCVYQPHHFPFCWKHRLRHSINLFRHV